jgi:NADH-quinone oxidoreductase subunit M
MNSPALALFQIAPYLLAFTVGVLIPRRQGKPERVAIGIVAALSLLLVRGLWPSASAAVVDENAKEWPYLLSVIVFLPILGAILMLFLPRQSPVILKRVTFLILGLDGLISLGLLSSPMTRGWHYQHIVDWVPAFGIRYHVAVDGVSMWLILLSTLTTPIAAYVAFGSLKTSGAGPRRSRRRTSSSCTRWSAAC